MFSFKSIIISCGYHYYRKDPSWSNVKMNEEVKVELEADTKSLSTNRYTCAIKAKHSYIMGWNIPQWGTFHVKFLVIFTFLLKKKIESFCYIKITQIQSVTNFIWKIESSSFMKGEVGNRYYGRIRRKLLQL